MSEGTRRVIVVDDHPLCAAAVAAVLAHPRWKLSVEVCGSLRELDGIGPADDIALILLDLKLPDATGMSGLQAVKAAFPAIPVCVMTGQTDNGTKRQVLAQGAAGFIPKTFTFDELSGALGRLLSGETVDGGASPALEEPRAEDGRALLSPAEQRIMQSLCLGLQNKQIAFDLGLSESTVKSHLARIFVKLQVTNRSQAIMAYERMVGRPG
jgi:DNA-binding NarL/FixJ family response regulator